MNNAVKSSKITFQMLNDKTTTDKAYFNSWTIWIWFFSKLWITKQTLNPLWLIGKSITKLWLFGMGRYSNFDEWLVANTQKRVVWIKAGPVNYITVTLNSADFE